MKRYRIKTKEEFIRDGDWEEDRDSPDGGQPKRWADEGKMNYLFGQELEDYSETDFENEKEITVYDVKSKMTWWIFSKDVVEDDEELSEQDLLLKFKNLLSS